MMNATASRASQPIDNPCGYSICRDALIESDKFTELKVSLTIQTEFVFRSYSRHHKCGRRLSLAYPILRPLRSL